MMGNTNSLNDIEVMEAGSVQAQAVSNNTLSHPSNSSSRNAPEAGTACDTTHNVNKYQGLACIHVAADTGNLEALKVLLEDDRIDVNIPDEKNNTALLTAIKRMYDLDHELKTYPEADYIGCLDLFLKNSKTNVNHRDISGNTALHYAAKKGDDETVLKLLQHRASVGLRNNNNELPLAGINAKTLETWLDECITTSDNLDYKHSGINYEIHMTYDFLVNPNNSCKIKNEPQKYLSINVDDFITPETDALLYMARNEELCPLLTHPVITTFLFLKWQCLRPLAYANLTFYSLLWLCLNLYIILGYYVEKKQSDSIEALNIVTYVGVTIGLILLIFRELFQMLLSPVKYSQEYENWMEIVLINIIGCIIFLDSASVSTKQQLSAVAILISSAELLLLIGQFPATSTNVLMLKTVSWNFFKFLVWYCILIIAFALSFFTLFREVEGDQIPPPMNLNNTDKEKGDDFFNDPFRALFKTIVMLTGEFDAGSIHFSTVPVTSHIIFILFIFMIPLVLFNLLQGLAVSDIQTIRADAELMGHISRVKLISYVESIIIGNAKICKYSATTSYWQDFNTRIFNLKAVSMKSFAKRICIFSRFRYKVSLKPNPDGKIYMTDIESAKDKGRFGQCPKYKLDHNIVKNIKIIISKKTDATEFDEMKASLFNKIGSIDITLNKVLETLERMSPKQD